MQGGVAVGLGMTIGSNVKVGITGVSPWTRTRVAVGALGGTKGVGVGVGAQADSRRNAIRRANKFERGSKRWEFIYPRKKCRDTILRVPAKSMFLIVGRFFVNLVVHDERHDQLTAQRFLADVRLDLK